MIEDHVRIAARYHEQVTTQSYTGKPQIGGVTVLDLRLMSDEGGDFAEIARLQGGRLEAFPQYEPAQISYSSMEPGTIKAFHLHYRQDDLWFIPPHSRLLIGLLDTREDSPTVHTAMRLTMGAGKARLLFIPRGVAHGVANLSSGPASLIYLTNQAFDINDPDERRLPFDLLGAEFWTIQPG